MVKGHVRVAVDKWGKIEPSDDDVEAGCSRVCHVFCSVCVWVSSRRSQAQRRTCQQQSMNSCPVNDCLLDLCSEVGWVWPTRDTLY